MKTRLENSFALLALAFAAPTLAHNHITVDTVSGNPGDPIVIRAGYYPDETEFTIDASGRLRDNGDFAAYPVADQLHLGEQLEGWYAADDLLLTSDFYFSTGRLDGGSFHFEITAVRAVCAGDATLAWGDFTVDGFVPAAFSDASTRSGRSYDVQIGSHNHEQGFAFSEPGVYDVQLVAWDELGKYADSNPITIRFQVGDVALPDVTDLDCSGSTDGGDIGMILLNFGHAAPGDPADLDGNGEIDGGDIGLVLLNFD